MWEAHKALDGTPGSSQIKRLFQKKVNLAFYMLDFPPCQRIDVPCVLLLLLLLVVVPSLRVEPVSQLPLWNLDQ